MNGGAAFRAARGASRTATAPGAPWTATRVLLRLEEAAETLRRLPPPHRRARLTSWPGIVRRAAAPDGPRRTLRAVAQPDAIDRMDEALVWLGWLPEATARIAWARANRGAWRDIAALAGLSPRTCQRRLIEGLLAVAQRLGRD